MKKIKVSEEFVKEAHNEACSIWKKRIENEFPDLFEKQLVKGKWYTNEGNDFLFRFNGKFDHESDPCGPGISNHGRWLDNEFGWANGILILANKSFVESKMREEYLRRGYTIDNIIPFKSGNEIKVNGFCMSCNERGYSSTKGDGGCLVFDGWKWAETKEEPKFVYYKCIKSFLMQEDDAVAFIKGKIYEQKSNGLFDSEIGDDHQMTIELYPYHFDRIL